MVKTAKEWKKLSRWVPDDGHDDKKSRWNSWGLFISCFPIQYLCPFHLWEGGPESCLSRAHHRHLFLCTKATTKKFSNDQDNTWFYISLRNFRTKALKTETGRILFEHLLRIITILLSLCKILIQDFTPIEKYREINDSSK